MNVWIACRVFMVVCLVAPHIGRAQTGSATDNELYAAYCKGALDEMLRIGQSRPSNFDPRDTPAQRQQFNIARQQALSALAAEAQRFASYLLSTGALTDPNRTGAIFGVSSAMLRGQADERQCVATSDRCNAAILGPPGAKPNANAGSRLFMCESLDPACGRSKRCLDPDRLPF